MQMVGNLLVGPAMHLLGRKTTIVASSVLLVVAFCIIAFAQTFQVGIAITSKI